VPVILTHRERRRTGRPGKCDPADALAIARVVLREERLPLVRDPLAYRDLKLLVDYRDQLIAEQTRLRNRLHSDLQVLMPGYGAQLGRLGDLKHATSVPAVRGLLAALGGVAVELTELRLARLEALAAEIAGSKDFATLPGVKEAASDLEKLVKGGYFISSFKSTDFTAAQLNFFQGKSAMILMGSWMVGEMKDSIPAGFPVGTFPFPSVSGGIGDQNTTFGSSNAMSVAAASKNPATGVAWLQFLAQKENQTSFVSSTGQISAYKTVAPPAGFESVVAGLKQPNSFVPSYFGVFGAGTKITDAYELPIAELFFGKTDAAGMVAAIDSNLRAATSG